MISAVDAVPMDLYPANCGLDPVVISADVADVDNKPAEISASFTYSGRINGTVTMVYNLKNGRFEGSLDGFKTLLDSTLSIVVNAHDVAGNKATPVDGPAVTTHSQCPVVG